MHTVPARFSFSAVPTAVSVASLVPLVLFSRDTVVEMEEVISSEHTLCGHKFPILPVHKVYPKTDIGSSNTPTERGS